uniref:Mce/MlaD domain-containing protein n=1 Tax=Polysiphonia sp. TaxID=1967842 RepID=A0A1Z1M406_9FLOR|nr:hypothetical protein [Polysiphonia sp.]
MNHIFYSKKNFFITFLKRYLNLLIFVLFIIVLISSFVEVKKDKGYLLFVEFNNSYGLKEGTSVNFRGVKIGFVSRVSTHLNKVVILLNIKTLETVIPQNSLFEANQIGLFNDIVISITPLDYIELKSIKYDFTLSKDCVSSSFICPNSYIKGYKGVNYDDLVRATTRISQRFDDPRFFKLFYLFLRNGINFSDELILLIHNLSNIFHLLFEYIYFILSKYTF